MQKDNCGIFHFETENFFINEDVDITQLKNPVYTDYMIVLACTGGSLQLKIKGKDEIHCLNKNNMAFIYSDYFIEYLSKSSDFEGKMLGFTKKFIKENFPSSAIQYHMTWHIALYARQNLILHISDNDALEIEQSYRFFKSMVAKTNMTYYNNVINKLTQTLIYHLASILENTNNNIIKDIRNLQSKDILCMEFLDLLIRTHPHPRSVNWYSEQLHKTPKYLSSVVKEVSGKTASEWIRDAICIEIADLLSNSSKSIKEICYDLEFPNLSFFGRYVRTNLGMSPKEYRKQKNSIKKISGE